MLDGGNRARQIDQMHDLAAEQIAENVGIVGQREFRILRDRFADATSFHRLPFSAADVTKIRGGKDARLAFERICFRRRRPSSSPASVPTATG